MQRQLGPTPTRYEEALSKSAAMEAAKRKRESKSVVPDAAAQK